MGRIKRIQVMISLKDTDPHRKKRMAEKFTQKLSKITNIKDAKNHFQLLKYTAEEISVTICTENLQEYL
jgi:purine-nucleoside phosphorylase